MDIRYGSAGHKGVKTLMAVGADELDDGGVAQAVKTGGYVALGAWVLGVLLEQSDLRRMALGAGIALFGVQMATGTLGKKKVEVVQDEPVPPGDWTFMHAYKTDAW